MEISSYSKMKFLACSRCFSVESNQQPTSQPIQEITNPLVVTKRPVPKILHPRDSEEPEPPSRKKRFPGLLSTLASWPRRRQPRNPKHPSSQKNVRKTVRVIEAPQRRRIRHRQPSRTQRLIRLYEEQTGSPEGRRYLQPPEFLIDPPASFSGDDSLESHQNFKNKLNTLDFKRMNTVALEEPSPSSSSRSESAIYRKNSYVEDESNVIPIGKCARKTLLEDFLKERLRIEQTMIDLLNGRDPTSEVLKKSRNEDKKVRFKVEDTEPEEKELRVDVTGEGKVDLTDDGRVEQETEIKLSIDPATKVEDFYIERRTTYMKDKTVEDKSLVLKIAPKDESQPGGEDAIGMTRARDMVFRNFGKMTL